LSPPRGSRARTSRLLGGALLGAVCASCELPPATAVAVAVKTELVLGEELAQVTYRVFPAGVDPDRTKPVAEFTTAAQTLDKPFIVTRAHADEFLLSVEGFGPDHGEPVIVYRERVRFERGKTLALRVFLARACLDRQCWFGGLTCFGEPYGGTRAGECDVIPGPRELHPVERPGEESQWDPEPTTATLIDAGFEPTTPFGPYDDLPLASDAGLSCSLLPTNRACWPPNPFSLDAASPRPLFAEE